MTYPSTPRKPTPFSTTVKCKQKANVYEGQAIKFYKKTSKSVSFWSKIAMKISNENNKLAAKPHEVKRQYFLK